MLSKIYHHTLNVLAIISALLIVLIMLGVAVDVFVWYLFNITIVWVCDLSQYALLYIPCLAMAWLARDRGHIAITTFIEKLPPIYWMFVSAITTFIAGT